MFLKQFRHYSEKLAFSQKKTVIFTLKSIQKKLITLNHLSKKLNWRYTLKN